MADTAEPHGVGQRHDVIDWSISVGDGLVRVLTQRMLTHWGNQSSVSSMWPWIQSANCTRQLTSCMENHVEDPCSRCFACQFCVLLWFILVFEHNFARLCWCTKKLGHRSTLNDWISNANFVFLEQENKLFQKAGVIIPLFFLFVCLFVFKFIILTTNTYDWQLSNK